MNNSLFHFSRNKSVSVRVFYRLTKCGLKVFMYQNCSITVCIAPLCR